MNRFRMLFQFFPFVRFKTDQHFVFVHDDRPLHEHTVGSEQAQLLFPGMLDQIFAACYIAKSFVWDEVSRCQNPYVKRRTCAGFFAF